MLTLCLAIHTTFVNYAAQLLLDFCFILSHRLTQKVALGSTLLLAYQQLLPINIPVLAHLIVLLLDSFLQATASQSFSNPRRGTLAPNSR